MVVAELEQVGLAGKIRKTIEDNPGSDALGLAEQILDTLERGELIELLTHEIAHRQRENVRDIEHQAFKDFFAVAGEKSQDVQIEGSLNFKKLFSSSFSLGNGEKIDFATATIEQHQQRIAMLTKLREGLDRTIEIHRKSIQLIEENGVGCLAEIERLV